MYKNNPDDIKRANTELNGIYRGVVEDNNDPLKAGRCRVRIFGIHTKMKEKDELEGIPTDELHWAQPALSLFEGSVTGFGFWTVPLQGSHVFVFFEAGNIMQPRYFASVPGIPSESPDGDKGFNDPDEEYPNTTSVEPKRPNILNEPDVHRLAREVTTNTPISYRKKNIVEDIYKADGGTWDEPEPSYETEYPHNAVLATHNGLVIEIDSTPDGERYHIYHPSHSYVEIAPNGRVIIRNSNNKYELVCGDKFSLYASNLHETVNEDKTLKVFGSETREINDNLTMTIGANRDESVGSNYLLNIGGTCDINVAGKCRITSSNNVTINAPVVHINNGDTGSLSTRTPGGSTVECEVYTEVDYGNMDDEPAVDDGLNIYPPAKDPSNPTPEEIARSEQLDNSPTETKEEDTTEAKDPDTIPADCSDITDPPDPNMQLSENYTLAELTTNTALSNYSMQDQAGLTSKESACNLRALAQNVLEPLATKYGKDSFVITSGFRHGDGTSQHEKGQAVDIQFPSQTNDEVYENSKWMKDNMDYDQMILEYGGNKPWIHVSYNQEGNRPSSHGAKYGTRTSAGNYEWGTLKNME